MNNLFLWVIDAGGQGYIFTVASSTFPSERGEKLNFPHPCMQFLVALTLEKSAAQIPTNVVYSYSYIHIAYNIFTYQYETIMGYWVIS